MSNIEEMINNLIKEKQYDKRMEPFIREYFLYNVKQHNWGEETVREKIELYKDRIDGMQLVPLGDKLVSADFDLKLLLLDEDSFKNMSYPKMIKLISQMFIETEIITENDFNWRRKTTYSIEKLKYAENQQDKESIIRMVTNSFNLKPEEIYKITDVLETKLKDTKEQDKDTKDYLEDCISIFVPEALKGIDKIIDTTSMMEKRKGYIDLYAISLLSFKYRLTNMSENKALIKQQYNTLNKEFYDKVEDYAITMKDLITHKIDNTWSIEIENISQEIEKELKLIPKEDIGKEAKIDNLLSGIREEFLIDIADIAKRKEVPLEQDYIEKEVQKIAKDYKEEYEPLLQEYFKRSAKIYGWTKDKFDEKLQNYRMSIKEVENVKRVSKSNGAVVGAVFLGKMELDKSLGKNETLSSFFHEAGHATDKVYRENKKLEDGIIERGECSNEYANEIGAVHLVGDKIYEDPLCFTHKMEGYEYFPCAGSMMAAALGISEFDFARLKDKGLKKFDKFFENNFSYMDIMGKMNEFDNILERIRKAPIIIRMKDMSEAYADMYNLANEIITTRLEHERKIIDANNMDKFELKSKYEKTKIAQNMIRAKRKIHLKNKYINPIVEDNTLLKEYNKIDKEDRKKYLSLVEELYPEKNIRFENQEILKHISKKIKHPIIGKIADRFKGRETPRLQGSTTPPGEDGEISIRKEFTKPYQIEKTPTVISTIEGIEEPLKEEELEKTEGDRIQ